jgi:hypothetical protein
MSFSRKLSVAGLILLAPVACWWLVVAYANPGPATLIGIGIMPPLALAICTFKRTRNWSGITALCMIVYAVLGMMDMVALSGTIGASLALGVLAVGNFFLVLDAGRRDG